TYFAKRLIIGRLANSDQIFAASLQTEQGKVV
ncbi:MAG: hypothetical protein ACI92Z_002105, partial [Paracoccaceae bacterium]